MMAFVQVKLKGPKEIDVTTSVKSVEVEDNDRLIDQVKIIFEDPDAIVTDILKEGLTVLVDMGWVAEHAVLFEGVVTQISSELQRGIRQVRLVALDLSYRMTLANDLSKSYSGKLSTIVENIVKLHGIKIGKIEIDPDPIIPAEKPLNQGHKSDWEFIQSLAEKYQGRAYIEYTVEKKEGASRFYFQPESKLLKGESMGRLRYCPGISQLVDFKFQRIAKGADAKRTATIVDLDTGKVAKTPQVPPTPPEKPVTPDPNKMAALAKESSGRAATYEMAFQATANPTEPDQHPKQVLSGLPSDKGAPEQVGKQDPTREKGFFGEGTTIGTIMLRAKGKVSIEGIAQWAPRDWYVRKVTHIYTKVIQDKKDRSTYQTKFVVTR